MQESTQTKLNNSERNTEAMLWARFLYEIYSRKKRKELMNQIEK